MPIARDNFTGGTRTEPLRDYRWPESEFYVSEKHRLVYCPIQKVACSSLKLWWAELVDGSSAPFLSLNQYGQESFDRMHGALNKRYKLYHQSPSLGWHPLTDEDWFRVVFVRNPWSRLVSVFVNKFVLLHNLAEPVFDEAHSRWGDQGLPRITDILQKLIPWNQSSRSEPLRESIWIRLRGNEAWKDEFTFRHFVKHLADCNLDMDDVDHHWRPQHRFLGGISFHFVGRFERLEQDMQTVSSRLGVRIDLPAVNCTNYQHRRQDRRLFADCPLKYLRQLGEMPDYRQFYTSRLRDQVADLYRRDVEQFGYEFDGWSDAQLDASGPTYVGIERKAC